MLTVVAGDLLADRTGRQESTVLALHGWQRDGSDFARVCAGTDTLAVHLPGFGPTPPPPGAWGSVEYADHLAEALSGTGPYVVVAHSFGGRVAVRLAVGHPELVRSLVLTGAPLVRATPPPRPAPTVRAAKWLRARGLLPQSVLDRVRQGAGSDDYRAAQGVMRDVFVRLVNEDYRDDLGKVDVPVTMVWGELDDSAPAAGALLAAELLPDVRLEVVPGAGHLLTGQLEQRVREALLDHLAAAGLGAPPSSQDPDES